MTKPPKIIVTMRRDDGTQEVVAEYPFGSWGLKSTMSLAMDLADKARTRGWDLESAVHITVGASDWPAQEAVDDMIMFDASFYPDQLGMLDELFERFAPGFTESEEGRISHLDGIDRETYADITIGTEKQIKYARDLFLEGHVRTRRMAQLLAARDELVQAHVDEAIKKVAAYLLVLVPKCSVFWIEKADSADIREMILARVTGEQRRYQTDAGIKLGKQVDEADRLASYAATP